MNGETLLFEIAKPESRPNPYPLYAEARRLGVSGNMTASTWSPVPEVAALLHDPRMSSDRPCLLIRGRAPLGAFIRKDPPTTTASPPRHEPLRPPQTRPTWSSDGAGLRSGSTGIRSACRQDSIRPRRHVAYPFPVAVICELLGVPREDEPKFHVLAAGLVHTAASVTSPRRRAAGAPGRDRRSSAPTSSSSSGGTERTRPTTCSHAWAPTRRGTRWRM